MFKNHDFLFGFLYLMFKNPDFVMWLFISDVQKSLFFIRFFISDVQESLFFIWFFGFRRGQYDVRIHMTTNVWPTWLNGSNGPKVPDYESGRAFYNVPRLRMWPESP